MNRGKLIATWLAVLALPARADVRPGVADCAQQTSHETREACDREDRDDDREDRRGNEPAHPDLIPVSLVASPEALQPRGTLTIVDSVQAVGGSVGHFRITYYLSSDATITPSDLRIGSRRVKKLAAGEVSTATTSVKLPAAAVGAYWVGMIVDTHGDVDESDETNNARAGNRVSIGSDAVPPVIDISGIADGAVVRDVPVTVCFAATDPNLASVTGTLDGVPVTGCGSAYLEGDHELVVTAADTSGNVATRTVHFAIDLTAPVLTVAGVADGDISSAASVTPTFSATDAHLAAVAATLDGLPFTSGTAVTDEGDHVLVVTARDTAGNTTTSQSSFSLDRTVPQLSIAGVTDGAVSNAASVTPTFSATDAHLASLVATLDGAPFTSGTPVTAEGDHVLVVTATDAIEWVATATVHFSIDRTAPQVAVTGVTDRSVSNAASVAPEFSATDAHLAAARATLDGAPFTSGSAVTAEGDHLLEVTATDAAGNSATARVSFAIDRTAPEISIAGVTDGSGSNAASVTPVFSATDARLASVAATLDGASFTSGTPVAAEGSHVLLVTAADAAGNSATARVSFVLDRTAPQITIAGVTDGWLGKDPSVTPSFGATDAHLAAVTATLNGVPFASDTAISAEGDHVLVVTAIDAAGNSATARVAFGIDRTAPTIRFAGITDGAVFGSSVTPDVVIDDPHPGTQSITIDNVPWVAGLSVDAEGNHVLWASATDAAGNSRSEQVSFAIDRTPPAVTIVAPAAGLVTAAGSVDVIATVTEDHGTPVVTIGGAPVARGADGRYRTAYALTEGPNPIAVSARDGVGNVETKSVTVRRDTAAPTLVVLSPAEGASLGSGTVTVSGTASDGSALKVTVAGAEVPLDSSGAFTRTLNLGAGPRAIEVVATDAAGNASTVVRNVTIAIGSEPPAVSIIEPRDGFVATRSPVSVRGTATTSSSASLTLTVNGGSVPVSGGAFSTTVDAAPGPVTITVVATDADGRSTTKTVSGTIGTDGKPTDPPPAGTLVLSVDSPAEGAIVGNGPVAVSGRVQGGTAPVTVTVAGQSTLVNAGYFDVALSLVEGDQTLVVKAADAAGNAVFAERKVSVDHTPPYLTLTRPSTSPAQATESPYLIEGTVGDVHLASVTVGGQPVTVLAGQFSRAVPLQIGANAIEVVAKDAAGNSTTRTVDVSIAALPPAVQVLEPLDGAQASAAVVRVRAHVEATSAVQTVTIGSGLATQEGADWVADVALALGENTIAVVATDASGLSGSATVHVRYRDVTQEPLAVTGVDPAPGASEVETNTLVSVSFNKPVTRDSLEGHFTVSADGAPLPGGFYVAPGEQTVSFVAKSPLPDGKRIDVRVDGVVAQAGPSMGSAFSARFSVRLPRLEAVGHILDAQLQPVEGVRVSVEGTGTSTRTGAEGSWHLLGVKPGAVVLRFEGGSLGDGALMPVIRRRLFVSGTESTNDPNLIMVPVDRSAVSHVDARSDMHLDFAGVHGGLALDTAAGGLYFEDGKTSGFVNATRIPPYALPVPIQNGRAVLTGVWQLAPIGIRFTAPVELTFPNLSGLAAGRYATVYGYDAARHMLQPVGIARVSADGATLKTIEPTTAGALDFFGYASATDEQQAWLEQKLGTGSSGGSPAVPSGTTGMNDVQPERDPLADLPLIARIAMLPLGTSVAHAQFMPFLGAFGPMPEPKTGTAWIRGRIRSPQEMQFDITPLAGVMAQKVLPLPYVHAVAFSAAPDPSGSSIPITLNMRAQRGQTVISPGSGEVWSQTGVVAQVSGTVSLEPGTTLITAEAQQYRDARTLQLEAKVVELDPDVDPSTGKRTRKAQVTVRKLDETAESMASSGISFFRNWPVEVTSSSTVRGSSGETGAFSVPVFSWGPDQGALACTEVQTGIRWIVNADTSDPDQPKLVQWPIMDGFPICQMVSGVAAGTSSPVSLLVDMRLLMGGLTFYNRDESKVPLACGADKTTWDPKRHELTQITTEDLRETEVYFFKEDDLSTPIANYAMAVPPDAAACAAGSFAFAEYKKLRFGPSERWTKRDIQDCDRLKAAGSTSDAFYKLMCEGKDRILRTRLSQGDRLIIFAVNHATGYAGATLVVVPPITTGQGLDQNGRCPADDAATPPGPITFQDFGQDTKMSRCARQDLSIVGNIQMYPPELDVRVSRRARAAGAVKNAEDHLVRHGSSATVRDDFVNVSTHWRVRLPPEDLDGDGTPNITDKCPKQPGPPENFGCPDPKNPTWMPPPRIVPPPVAPTLGSWDTVPTSPGAVWPYQYSGAKPGPAVDPFDMDGDGIPDIIYDRDGDGVPDVADRCPLVKGDAANNGCPAGLDSDHDGTPDAQEKPECILQPGPPDNGGCPDPARPYWTPPASAGALDSDGDGIPDSQDLCPFYPGPAVTSGPGMNGCPSLVSRFDTDEDGTPDSEDECPWQQGPPENLGCPDPLRPSWTPPAAPPAIAGGPGKMLETYCSELANPTPEQIKMCTRFEARLMDVPAGVPPLAGQLVRVTGTAVEKPAVAVFPVRPGKGTSNVQAGLRLKNTAAAAGADPSGLGTADQIVTTNLAKANYYVHVVGNLTLFNDKNGDKRIDPATEIGVAPPAFNEPKYPPADWKPGLPERAIALKNVYKSLEPDGAVLARFDRDREHEFRVLDLSLTAVTARQADGTWRDVTTASGTTKADSANEGDLAYQFLMHLVTPADPGRAKTLPGSYRVRMGTDDYGIDCGVKIDNQDLVATCDGAWLYDVLSARDLVYISLSMAGNAENILYKYNLQGLSPRRDILSAGHEYTVQKSVKADASNGTPDVQRPISQPALANLFVGPSQFKRGSLMLCAGSCSSSSGIIRQLDLTWQPTGSYQVTDVSGSGTVEQVAQAGQESASLFRIPIPPQYVEMTGFSAAGLPAPLKVVAQWLDKDDPAQTKHDVELGRARGAYTGAHSRARGQDTVAGVNLGNGHLSFRHEDFSLPELGGHVQFARTYNNQDNDIGTLGIGWRHSLEASVVEERPGRYTVVVEGQAYDFVSCTQQQSGNRKIWTSCTTDGSHGATLTVAERPEADPSKPKHIPDVVFQTVDGVRYRFDRYSQSALQPLGLVSDVLGTQGVVELADYQIKVKDTTPIAAAPRKKQLRDAGRRRWVLTAIDDGHGETDPNDPYKLTKGWSVLEYYGDSDNIRCAYRKQGKIALWFTYDPVNVQSANTSPRFAAAAAAQNFGFLKKVEARVQVIAADGTLTAPPDTDPDGYLVRVAFAQTADGRGNLWKAERIAAEVKANAQVDQAWEYSYVADPSQPTSTTPKLTGEDLWDATNELVGADLKIDGVVQSQSRWSRSGTATGYAHMKPFEIVDQATLPGQGGKAIKIAFSGTTRTVTEPGATDDATAADVVTTYELNDYGNTKVITVGGSMTRLTWGSDQPGGKVVLTSETSPTNRVITHEYDDRLRETLVTLVAPGADTLAAAGIVAGTVLRDVAPAGADAKFDERYGVPLAVLYPAADGTKYTEATELWPTGDVKSRTVTDSRGRTIRSRQYTSYQDGVLRAETDDEGRTTAYADSMPGSSGSPNPFGLAEYATITFTPPPGTQPPSGGATPAHRTTQYDHVGRVKKVSVPETGYDETWEYYASGRIKKHDRAGKPAESRHWEYVTSQNRLEVKEFVGTESTPRRKKTIADGLLETETFVFGAAEKDATRTYTHIGSKLVRLVDERGVRHRYFYDAAGRLLRGTALGAATLIEADEFARSPDAEGKPLTTKDHNGLETKIKYDVLGRPASWDRSVAGDLDTETVERDLGGAVAKRVLTGVAGSHTYTFTLDPLGRVEKADSADGSVKEERTYVGGRLATIVDRITELEQGFDYADALGRLTRHWKKVQGAEGTGSAELYDTETRSYALDTGAVKVTANHSADWKDVAQGGGSGTNAWWEEWTEDPLGRVLTRTTLVHGARATRTYEYDPGTGELWKAWEPGATSATVTDRDRAGYVVAVTDPAGNQITYETDPTGLTSSQTGPLAGESRTTTYDAYGQPATRTVGAWGSTPAGTWTYTWNAGVLTEKDPLDYTTERTYNAAYKVVKELRKDDGGTTTSSNQLETTFEYFGGALRNKVEKEKDSLTYSTVESDARGRERRRYENWLRGPLEYEYEALTTWTGRVATVTRSDKITGDSKTILLVHDSVGNVVSRTRGAFTDAWAYDAAGRVAVKRPSGLPATAYDYTEGLLTQERFGQVPEVTSYTYHPTGRLHTGTTASGRTKTLEYNSRGLVENEKYGWQGSIVETSFSHDAAGNVSGVTRGGVTWGYKRGPREELQAVTQPGPAGVYSYEYDALARLRVVKPPGSDTPVTTGAVVQKRDYDYLGRETLRTAGTAQWVTGWASAEGETTEPDNGKRTVQLDGRGRIAQVRYSPSPKTAPNTDFTQVTFTHGALNEPLTVTEDGPGRTLRYDYDERDLLKELHRGRFVVAYTYHPSGQRETERVSATWGIWYSGTTTYDYDPNGRLLRVSGNGQDVLLGWEPGGEDLWRISDGTVVEIRCHDGPGRLTRIGAVARGAQEPGCGSSEWPPANPLVAFDYKYDSRGNRASEAYTYAGAPGVDTTIYGYDDADRLTGVGYGNGTAVVYGISGDGSRRGWKEIPYYSGTLGDYDTTTLTPARADSYAFATNGALASGTGWQHEVDDLGRVTALKTSSIEYQRRYSWDAAGRLREAWVPPAGTAKYTYDPDGLRQERDLSGIDIPETGTSNYLWGDGGLSQMKVAGGAPIALYGVGEASYANGDRVLKDGIGSPVARVATGAVAGRWRYDAWGNYRAIADHQGPGTWADATGFTGHQWDGAPQLLYAQQRWYDPETGRFLSRDPVPGSVESPQTLNPYVYAAANPTRYTDPTGAFLPVLPWLAQVAVAGIASFAAGMSWNLVYQEVTGPRGWDYGSLDYGRAAKFGAATAGIGVSGAAFGAATAVSGFGIGGAFNLGGQTLVDGRSLSQVDWGSVYLEGGAGAAVGGAFRWGATSARAGVQFATGFAGMTMSSLGVVNGVQNIGRGVDALAWGETGRGLGLMVFGGAEAGLGWLGARESFEVYERSGLEFYSKGAGSNFANLGVRARGAARMQERAAELNIARDEWMAERGTTAAARVRNRVTGKTETWIATESDGPMPVEWEGKLSRNERFVEGPGHAEETLRSALGEEWELLYGGASRNVCSGRCAPLLRDEGLTIGGPRFRGKADKTRYRMFWKPR